MKRFPRYPARPHKSGQARVRIGDRSVYLGAFNSAESWAAYNRLLAEWNANRECLPSSPRGAITVIELADRWDAHAAAYYAGSTEERDFRDSLKPLVRLYGDTLASDFGPRALKAVREAMVSGTWRTDDERKRTERRHQHAGWTRKLINQRVGRIVRVFRWAAAEELVAADVWQRLRTVEPLRVGKSAARETSPVRPVAASAVVATLPHLPPAPRVMVELQLLTGMRPGELCRLTPGEIDREPVVGGQRLPGVWVYWPAKHKTAHRDLSRAIVFGPRAQAILEPILVGRAAGTACFSPQESETLRLGRAPWRPCGDTYNPRSYAEAVSKACRKAKVEHWHPHQLRHSRATDLRHAFGLDAARAVLGHQDPRVTQVYAERDLLAAAEVMRKVG